MQLRGKPRGVAPCPHQRLCLWTPRRVFDPLDTHFAIELSALSGYARVLIRPLSRRSGQRGLAAIKVNKHGCAPEGVKGAIGKPPCRARRREIPCLRKRATMVARPTMWSRPLARQYAASWIERLGGAPAGAQSYWQGRFAACTFVGGFLGIGRPRNSWGVAPNPTRELRPLTPQGGLPLDPFLCPGLVALPYFFFSGAFFAFSFAFFS